MAQQYGRWRTVATLDQRGRQGVVLQVEDAEGIHEGAYALKRLRDMSRLDRFRREISVLQKLRHPGILQVVDADADADKPYFVTPLHEGSLLDREYSSTATIPTLRMFRTIVDAVSTAHSAGIVHRDLKPDNILIDSSGDPIVADFGICYVDDGECRTMLGDVMGARGYTAPEILDGDESAAQPRADIYSLGKLLYWMLLDKHLNRERFEPRHALHDMEPFPVQHRLTNRLLDGMLKVDPRDRIGTADEVSRQLNVLIRTFTGEVNTPTLSRDQRCIYCRLGTYRPLALDRETGASSVPKLANFHGLGQQEALRLIYMECDYCGNVQKFRPGAIQSPNKSPWV